MKYSFAPRIVFFPLLCLLVTVTTLAQNRSVYPDNFMVYFNAMHLVNPSFIPEKGKLNFGTVYKTRSRLSDISTFEVHAEKIFRKSGGNSQLLRMYLFNEQEGPYISYPKIFFNYAIGIPLGPSSIIYAGVSAGLSRISYSAPISNGSATIFDASAGLSFRHKNIYLGAASYQLMNSTATVISNPVLFQRYFHVHGEAKKKVYELLEAKAFGFYRNLPAIRGQLNGGGAFVYNNFFETGGIYQLHRGLALYGTFRFSHEQNPLSLTFAYNTVLLSSLGPSYEFYEISLNYVVK